jgi:hypothetical protein
MVSADREAEDPPVDRWLGLKVGCSSAASSPALDARMTWKHRLAVGRRSESTDRQACRTMWIWHELPHLTGRGETQGFNALRLLVQQDRWAQGSTKQCCQCEA